MFCNYCITVFNTLQGVGVVYDTEEYCEHCKYGWEVTKKDDFDGYSEGFPLRCNHAELDWVWENLEMDVSKYSEDFQNEFNELKKQLGSK